MKVLLDVNVLLDVLLACAMEAQMDGLVTRDPNGYPCATSPSSLQPTCLLSTRRLPLGTSATACSFRFGPQRIYLVNHPDLIRHREGKTLHATDPASRKRVAGNGVKSQRFAKGCTDGVGN